MFVHFSCLLSLYTHICIQFILDPFVHIKDNNNNIIVKIILSYNNNSPEWLLESLSDQFYVADEC